MVLDDLRKTLEATLGLLTPAKAQQLAKDMMDPGTAKEQIAKTAADLMDWSQSNRERLSTFIRTEISEQMKNVGVATTTELDAVKKRVRDLERAGRKTASGRTAAPRKSPARRKPSTTKRSASGSSGNGSGSTGA